MPGTPWYQPDLPDGYKGSGGLGRPQDIPGGLRKKWQEYKDATNRDTLGQRERLAGESDAASDFARISQQKFTGLGSEANQERDYLRKVARGEESVSRMQLAQALQQNQAQQQSMAAGARGGNQAMAARQAAMNAGRQGAGLAGQQSIAGIQERQAAQSQLAQQLMAQRQQELQAAGQARGQAIQGYGGGFNAAQKQPTGMEQGMQLVSDFGKGIKLLSDEREKTNVETGDADADKVLRALKAVKYDYKDPKYGAGKQLGIMAQGLEKAGLAHTIINMDDGKKAVHGAKLAAALTSMMPGINQRLEALEGKKK